jgi:uncharacterized protein (DUF1684 family)
VTSEYLELADWRRRVAEMWRDWREQAVLDPEDATVAFRAAKDDLFREHPQSPIPRAERRAFRGLAYWPYDPAWRMTVPFDPAEGDPGPYAEAGTSAGGALRASGAIRLPSSGSTPFAFRRAGSVALGAQLENQALSIFWIDGYAGGLFLAFRDATSGSATYGAGRYLLDTIKGADHGGDWRAGTLVLDFNMAFHPSCAYDPRWSCPLAPPENRLEVAVPAGERMPAP